MRVADPSASSGEATLASLQQRARAWCAWDPNETTAAYVRRLLEDESEKDELEALFPENDRISFGTAGLRAAMKPGNVGMNDLVVLQTAQGLARYCQRRAQQQQDDENKKKNLCVVVGYDHRANPALQLSSLSFALWTALVFLQAGMDCFLLDGPVATPLVPFAMSQLAAQPDSLPSVTATAPIPVQVVLGIMITASHNPKQDAGYKVYWSDGCQIRSPADQAISACIQENLEPWVDYRAALQQRQEQYPNDTCLGLSDAARTKAMIAAYFIAIQSSGLVTGQAAKLGLFEDTNRDRKAPKFCYTAMHGIGHSFAVASFKAFGLPPFVSVPAQEAPDPDFPTVPFPNPEEQGALDLAKAYAEQQGCDIVLANDPDADRLAVAERRRDDGTWQVFTGDQIGTMLGHWLWEQVGRSCGKPVAMCASTVSSRMLAEIAQVEGFHFEDTLTGFKWIGSRAAALQRDHGYQSLFCYEEAIGFCCGNTIFDKDGISALGVFAELAVSVYHEGKSLAQHMQSLYDKYGEFVSCNGYFFMKDPTVAATIMDKITNHGAFDKLDSVGPYPIESIRYLGEPGYDSTTADHKPTLPTSQSSPLLTLRFVNGCVVQFRASGTEPKFKYYIEMKGQPGTSRDVVTSQLQEMSEVVLETLLQPSHHGLVRP